MKKIFFLSALAIFFFVPVFAQDAKPKEVAYSDALKIVEERLRQLGELIKKIPPKERPTTSEKPKPIEPAKRESLEETYKRRLVELKNLFDEAQSLSKDNKALWEDLEKILKGWRDEFKLVLAAAQASSDKIKNGEIQCLGKRFEMLIILGVLGEKDGISKAYIEAVKKRYDTADKSSPDKKDDSAKKAEESKCTNPDVNKGLVKEKDGGWN